MTLQERIQAALDVGAWAIVNRLEQRQYEEDQAYVDRRTAERWRGACQRLAAVCRAIAPVVACGLILLAVTPGAAQQKVPAAPTAPKVVPFTTYNPNSQTTGYGKIDPKSGRYDTYDVWSNRTGFGYIRLPAQRQSNPEPRRRP